MAASQATSVMLAMLLATICLARSCEGATGRATYYIAPYVRKFSLLLDKLISFVSLYFIDKLLFFVKVKFVDKSICK